jgi:hypothetical protein
LAVDALLVEVWMIAAARAAPGRSQVVANLARRAHGSQSESRSTDHGHPIVVVGAGGPSPLRLLEWRISDVHRRISTYIPATLRPWNHPIRSRFSLQIGHFGAIAQLAERLDRTSFGTRPARLAETPPASGLGCGITRWGRPSVAG